MPCFVCSFPKLPSATVGGADGGRVGGATLQCGLVLARWEAKITLSKEKESE